MHACILTAVLIFTATLAPAAEKSEYVAKFRANVNLGGVAEFEHEITSKIGEEIVAEFVGPNGIKLGVRVNPHRVDKTQYKAEFKIQAGKDTLSSPAIVVQPDQTGTITVGEMGRESIKIELIVTEK